MIKSFSQLAKENKHSAIFECFNVYFNLSFLLTENAMISKNAVLVHCAAGISRFVFKF